jgi:hypothetical protein
MKRGNYFMTIIFGITEMLIAEQGFARFSGLNTGAKFKAVYPSVEKVE